MPNTTLFRPSNATGSPPSIAFINPTIVVVEGDTASANGVWGDLDKNVTGITLEPGNPGAITHSPTAGQATGTFNYQLVGATLAHDGVVIKVNIVDANGNASSTTATLSVTPAANTAPTILVDAPEYFVDAGGSVTVEGDWIDPDATALPTISCAPVENPVVVTGGPTTGRWSMRVDASPDATPPPFSPPNIIDTDTTFTFTLTDSGGLTDNVGTNVRISDVGQGPSIQWNQGSLVVVAGQVTTISLGGTWSDAQGNVTGIALRTFYGSISHTGHDSGEKNGTFIWTSELDPQVANSGPVTVQIADANNLTDTATMTFTVNEPANTPPVIAWDQPAVDAAIGSQITATGTFIDPDLDIQQISVIGGNGSILSNDPFSQATGAWTWQSTANLQPSDAGPITVRAVDAAGNQSNIATMNLTVSAVAGAAPTLVAQHRTRFVSQGNLTTMRFDYADTDGDIASVVGVPPLDGITNAFDQIVPAFTGADGGPASGTLRWLSNTLSAGTETGSYCVRVIDSQQRVGDAPFGLVVQHSNNSIGIDVDQDVYTINNGQTVTPTGTWGAYNASREPDPLVSVRADGEPIVNAASDGGQTGGDWTHGPIAGLTTGSHVVTTQITHPDSGLQASVQYTIVVVAVGAPPIVEWDFPSVTAQEGDAVVTHTGTFRDADADIQTLSVTNTGARSGTLSHGSLSVVGPASFTWTLANAVQGDAGDVTVTATDANGNTHMATMSLNVTSAPQVNICDVTPAPTVILRIDNVTGPDEAQINGDHSFVLDQPGTETGMDCEGSAILATNPNFGDRVAAVGFSQSSMRFRHRTFGGGANAGQFLIVAEANRSYTDYPWNGLSVPLTTALVDSNNNDWSNATITTWYPSAPPPLPGGYTPAGTLRMEYDSTTLTPSQAAAYQSWYNAIPTNSTTGRPLFRFSAGPEGPQPPANISLGGGLDIRSNRDEPPVLDNENTFVATAYADRLIEGNTALIHHQLSFRNWTNNQSGYYLRPNTPYELVIDFELVPPASDYDQMGAADFGIPWQLHPAVFRSGYNSLAVLNMYIDGATDEWLIRRQQENADLTQGPRKDTRIPLKYGRQQHAVRLIYDPSGQQSYFKLWIDGDEAVELTDKWGYSFSGAGGEGAANVIWYWGSYVSRDIQTEPVVKVRQAALYEGGWSLGQGSAVVAGDVSIANAQSDQPSVVNLVTTPGNQNLEVGDTTIEHLESSRMRDAQVSITQATGNVTITPDVRDTGRKVPARFKVTNNTSGLSDTATVEVSTVSKPMYQFISVKSQTDLANILDPVGNGFPADTELWAMSHQGFNDFGLFDKIPGESNAGWIEAVAAAGRPMFLSFQPGVDWTNWSLAQTASPPASPTLQPGLASYMEGLPQATKDLIIGIQIEHAVAAGGTPESVNLGNATQVVQDAIPSLANKISAYNINPPKPNGDRLTYFTKLGYQLQPSATTGRKQYQFALTHEASVDTHLNNRPGGNVYQVNPNGFNGFIWNGLGGQALGTATPDNWDNAYRRIIHEPYAQTLRRLTLQHQIGMLGVILFTFQFSRFADITVDDETPLALENMLDHRLSQWNETIKAYNDYSNGTLSGNMVNVDQGDFIQDVYSHGSA